MVGRGGGVFLTLRLLWSWRLVGVRRRRGVIVALRRVGAGGRSGAKLVGCLVVVVRRRIAVHGYRCLWLRRRSESLVEVVKNGEVGFNLGRREAPGRVVERSVERRSFEVVASVYDSAGDEVGVRFEDGRAVEGSRREAVTVDEKGMVADCRDEEVSFSREIDLKASDERNGKVFSSLVSCLSELWFSK
jgi:hypothetical protein